MANELKQYQSYTVLLGEKQKEMKFVTTILLFFVLSLLYVKQVKTIHIGTLTIFWGVTQINTRNQNNFLKIPFVIVMLMKKMKL